MIDPGHFLRRLTDPFTPESRFYWPFVIAIFVAMVAHTAWYLWRPTKPRNPVRDRTETIAYWTDLIVLVLLLVAVSAKVRAWQILLLVVLEWGGLAWLYLVYAPPRFAAWVREQRKRRFIPEPKRRRRSAS